MDPISFDLEKFLDPKNINTKNVMYNIAVVNARLSNAIARALNLQKTIVESISEEINRISLLNVEINSYKVNDPKDPSKRGSFGKTAAESLRMLEALKAYGVKDLDTKIELARKGTEIPTIIDSDLQLWSQQLNAKSENFSSKSQQETLRIQTFTSRYTQATDHATNVLQKDGQSKSAIITNLR